MTNALAYGMAQEEPVFLFPARTMGEIPGLKPGSKLIITSQEMPEHQFAARIATKREFNDYVREVEFVDDKDWFEESDSDFVQVSEVQRFSLLLPQQAPHEDARLTAEMLSKVVLPIILALSKVQSLLFGTEPIVREISQNSPVNISLEGAGSLYEKIAVDVIPWRRKRAQQIAELEAAKRRAELEQKRAEVLAAEAATQRGRAESEKAMEAARLARAEAGLKELELTRARFELATDMVERLQPNASKAEKLQLVSELMSQLVRLTGTVELIAVSDASPEQLPSRHG